MDEQNNDQMQQPFQGPEQGQQMNQYPNQYPDPYQGQYPNQFPNQNQGQFPGRYPNMQDREQNERIYDVSVISMILGIWAVLTICFFYISIPSSIGGIILASIGLKSNRRGKGFAIAGLVLSIIAIAPCVLLIIIGYSVSSVF